MIKNISSKNISSKNISSKNISSKNINSKNISSKNKKKIEIKSIKNKNCTYSLISTNFGNFITNHINFNKWQKNNNFKKWLIISN